MTQRFGLKHPFLFLSLAALVIFIYWRHNSPGLTLHLSSKTLNTIPDQRVVALNVKQFDETGALLHHLTTPLMQHTPEHDTHRFSQPVIRITKPNQPAWTIQSQEAIAVNQGQHITFRHHVLIQHHAYEQHPAGVIQTDYIRYFPKQKLATTLSPITWKQAHNIVQSTGMKAYLDTQRIDLLSSARASYEPIS